MTPRKCLIIGILVFCWGCDSRPTVYPVEGQVFYSDGQPASDLKGGQIELTPTDGKVGARAVILADGKFQVGTNKLEDGAVPGDYLVAIVPPEGEVDKPVVRLIDPKYSNPTQSGLKVTIKPERTTLKLDVDKINK